MLGSFLRRWGVGALLLTWLIACGGAPTAEITTADGVKSWAGASAVGVYRGALAAFDPSSTTRDPSCPSVATSGTTQTYTGNCTDSSGVKWIGTATVVSATGTRASSTKLNGFGSTSQVTCQGMQLPNTSTTDGTVTTTDDGSGTVRFKIDTEAHYTRPSLGGCSMESGTSDVVYAGSYANNGMEPTTWNGSGDVDDSLRGQVHAVTANEVLDHSKCASEALSGTTTLTADEHTAVITYDGATSCDVTSTVTWTLDGAPKGEIAGIACSARPLPGQDRGAGRALLLAVALALVSVARRRRPMRWHQRGL